MKSIFYFSFFILCINHGFAQNTWAFGLSSQTVLNTDSLNQTKSISNTITSFLKNACLSESNTAEDINSAKHIIYKDSKGNIWYASTSSCCCHFLFRLDVSNANNSCINNLCKHDLNKPQELTEHNTILDKILIRIKTKESNKSIAITSFLSDKNGNIWFGSWDSGVYSFDGKSLVSFSNMDGLNRSYVNKIIEDKKGAIWFSTAYKNTNEFQSNGAFSFDGKVLKHFTAKDGLCNNAITCMMENTDGKIWFGSTANGVSNYDGNKFTTYIIKNKLRDKHVDGITNDKLGNLWFSTWELIPSRYETTQSVYKGSELFIDFLEKETEHK
jgi:hypothetical protein